MEMRRRWRTQCLDCRADCVSALPYKLDAIAREIASLFKTDVVVQTDVGGPFPDATIERHETGFAFLERLCRLRSVLATDDEQGRLVLTRAGNDRAHVPGWRQSDGSLWRLHQVVAVRIQFLSLDMKLLIGA
jgi:prophage tail gpP-like protein